MTVSKLKPKTVSLLHVMLTLNGIVSALGNIIYNHLKQVSKVYLEPNQISVMEFFRKGS